MIGHSLGGAIALHLTLERPELVERLGLVAPAGLGKAPPWWWYAIAGYEHGVEDTAVRPQPAHAAAHPAGHDPLPRLAAVPRPAPDAGDHRPPGEHAHGPARPRPAACGRPLLHRVLHAARCWRTRRRSTCPSGWCGAGTTGWSRREHADAYARVHPDADVHVFEDCGHYPHIELPSRFNRLLRGTGRPRTAAVGAFGPPEGSRPRRARGEARPRAAPGRAARRPPRRACCPR